MLSVNALWYNVSGFIHPEGASHEQDQERIHDSNLRYKQGLGQNFIYDEDLLAALVASSEITKDDDVLEIGPAQAHDQTPL